MEVGERIREVRKEKKLSQVEVAKKAGIAVNSLRLYEANKRQPSINQIREIAAALEINWMYLLGHPLGGETVAESSQFAFDYKKYEQISDGVMNIIAAMYGGCESKKITGTHGFRNELIFGNGADAFYIDSEGLDVVQDSIEAIIKPLIEHFRVSADERIAYMIKYLSSDEAKIALAEDPTDD